MNRVEASDLGTLGSGGEADPETAAAAEKQLFAKMSACQQKDREHWRGILTELRSMKRDGHLVPVRTPVCAAGVIESPGRDDFMTW
ncbi:MAG: hypothetical protein JXR37_10005 [Kiritimatiellae bacterium]|nr:hypothetical protein [Kiritimatiellia bacterium]